MGTVSLRERKMNYRTFVLWYIGYFFILKTVSELILIIFFPRDSKLFDSGLKLFLRGLQHRSHQQNFFLFYPWHLAILPLSH